MTSQSNIKSADTGKEAAYSSPYEQASETYAGQGYHPITLAPDSKKPSYLTPDETWADSAWSRYRHAPATAAERRRLGRQRDRDGYGAGIGICLGTPAGNAPDGRPCVTAALDVDPAAGCDHEAELMAAINAAIPGVWSKKGAKGGTFLVRVPASETEVGFDYVAPGGSKVQLLLNAQTVMPPSIHPDTGKAYFRLGDATRQNADALPIVELTALDALLGRFGYVRSIRAGNALGDAQEQAARVDIALGDEREGLIASLAGAAGDLGGLWLEGAATAFMQTPTKAKAGQKGKERDRSGSGLRLELARQMARAGYSGLEFQTAVLEWDHATGRLIVTGRDIHRAWGSAGLPVLADLREAAAAERASTGAGNFGAVEDADDLATPEARAVLDPAMAAYALKYPKVIEGKEVRIARRHTLSDGSTEVDLIVPSKFRDFVPADYVEVPTAGGGTKRVHLADLYMKADVHLLRGRQFAPGLEQIDCPDHLNSWTGWGLKPSNAGSCEAFKAHLLQRVCGGNAEYFGYLWAWMAQMFQFPRVKPGVAVVIQGGKGSGKTLVGTVLGRLIGRKHYLLVKDRDQVLGKFNAPQADALLLQLEECLWAPDGQAAGVLKSLITETFMQVERKGVDAVTVPSYLRIMMTSNEAFVVPATEDERRFLVLRMTNENIVGATVDTMMGELNAGGYARLLFELLATDLSGFNSMRPPATEALAEQVKHNRSTVEEWWADEIDDGGLWRLGLGIDAPEVRADGALVIRAGVLKARYVKWRQASGLRGMNNATWAAALEKLGFIRLVRNSGNLWIIPARPGWIPEAADNPAEQAFACVAA